MVCRVNLGWTIDLLWKTQHRRMMLRVRFRFPLPARVAHHRNVPRLGSNHPSHPASSVPHVHYRCLLLTTTSVTSSTTSSSSSSAAVTTPIAYTHTDAAPFRTSTVPVAMVVAVVVTMVVTMIVVVVTIVSSPVTAICCFLLLEIQAFQLFAEVVIAAVLVWVIPVVPFAGRSGTTGTERILVTELFAFAIVLVKVRSWRGS